MSFNSATFILFLALVLVVYYLPIGWRSRKSILLFASYFFYAAWNPPFVLLLWLSTIVDYLAAQRIFHSPEPSAKRLWFAASLLVNLGTLSYFKYGGFLLDNFVAIARQFSVIYQPAAWDIILPMGISFYTFQTLSYTIDIFRGNGRLAPSFLDFALYVTFFPQLVAGPIVRADTFLPQCAEAKRSSARQLGRSSSRDSATTC